MSAAGLLALGSRLDSSGGTVSIWYGSPGHPPAYARLPDAEHYAASTIKLGLLVAAYRVADAGRLDLESLVDVHDDFASAAGGRFRLDRGEDNDEEPWERLGGTASLRWLARRMIVRSSNLATNLLLEAVGFEAVADAFTACGATHSVLRRPIGDDVAAAAGAANLVAVRDLGELLGALAVGTCASAAPCAEMLDVLSAQEYRDGIPAGIPLGTPVASKGGWVDGVLHDAALIRPADAAPYVLVVCTTGAADAAALIRAVAAASWTNRHRLG